MSTIAPRARLTAIDAKSLEELPGATVIDLRSPGEFAQDHAPGARNLPLFDDDDRALIGTLYSRRSPQTAFDAARDIARRRIRELVAEIGRAVGWEPSHADLEQRLLAMTDGGLDALDLSLTPEPIHEPSQDAVVFCCWRGGLRSRSVVAYVRALGLDRAVVLAGGYKSYRSQVRATIAGWRAPRAVVLRGLTGVGKTLVLQRIERLRPGWTIDLEELALHRGSILGMVGKRPRTQKAFESGLAARLRAIAPQHGASDRGVVVLEGESRKVGDVNLPSSLWSTLEGGVGVELFASVGRRVDVLIADYLAIDGSRAQLRAKLPFIEQRLGPRRWTGRLVAMLDAGLDGELARQLLEHYYDPLYRHSERGRTYAARFDADDPEAAARAIVDWIESGASLGAPRA